MKDRGTPVSLFSFQDIVTSLTGIMVIIILVIALQLTEAQFEYENPKTDNAEFLELQARIQALGKRLQELQNMGEEIPSEFQEYVSVPMSDIEKKTKEAAHANAIMRGEEEKHQEDMEKLRVSIEQLATLLKATQEKKGQLTGQKKEMMDKLADARNTSGIIALERQLDTLERERERLKNELRVSADKVEFSFEGIMSRQPILIECSGNGFRAQVYKSGEEVVSFEGGGFQANLSKLLTWLRKKDLKKCYPVLLLRSSAFSHLDDIESGLYGLDKQIVWGKEPLDGRVKVF